MDEVQSEPKKKRFQNACDECRKKKVRCDSAVVPGKCTNCVSWNLDCTHNLQRKKRGPIRSRKGEDSRVLVNAILSTVTPFIIPEDPEEVREILHTLANHARSLDRQLSLALGTSSTGARTDQSSSLGSSPEADTDPQAAVNSLTLDLKKIALGDEKRQYGKSSHLALMQNALDAQQDRPGNYSSMHGALSRIRRLEFWRPFPWQIEAREEEIWHFYFPEEELLQELIHDYFVHFNVTYPILHRPTFERAVLQGLHRKDKSFGQVLLVVCALGSRYSNDPRHLTEPETTSECNRGWKYFKQISFSQNTVYIKTPSLYDLQFRSLSLFYLQAMNTPEVAWMIVGIGIRLAQEVGAHRKSLSKNDDPVEHELWKRAFWALIFFDLVISSSLGRPRATTSDDFDLEPPIECDDEFWEHPDPTKAFIQPEGRPSTVSFFVSILRLLELIAFAHRFLYPVRKSEVWSAVEANGESWDQNMIRKLDSALNEFTDTIPDHLKWPPEHQDIIFFQQSALLNSTYHWVRIQVHRYFLHGEDAGLPYHSLVFCNNASKAALNTLEALRARMEPGILSIEKTPLILGPLLMGVMLALFGLRQSRREDNWISTRRHVMSIIHRFLVLLKDYEPKYQLVGRVMDVMNAVMSVGNNPEESRTGSKRSRPSDDRDSAPLPQRSWDTFHSVPSMDSAATFISVDGEFGGVGQLPFLAGSSFETSPPRSNELTEDDWDVFMSNIDSLLSAGAGNYAGF